MDQRRSAPSVQDDVLHSTDHSKLTPEEIAKAIAHHNKQHPQNKLEASGKSGAARNQGPKKNK